MYNRQCNISRIFIIIKSKYEINYRPGCVMFIHVSWLWMCVWFYLSFVCVHVSAYAFKFKVHRRSAFDPGACGLPYYCTHPVFFPDVTVIGALAVWQHKHNKNNDAYGGLILLCLREAGFSDYNCSWVALSPFVSP